MPKQERIAALVLPSDEPPRRSALRRLLLFFDRVVLPNPKDRALIADGEIVERFKGPGIREIRWAEQIHFPRAEGYLETTAGLRAELQPLESRGLVTFLPSAGVGLPPARRRLEAYSAAINNPDLVRAAVPDLDVTAEPCMPRSTLLWGSGITKKGEVSKYAVDFGAPFEMPESQRWSHVAWLRLARATKYLDAARIAQLCPVAMDATNTSIALGLSGAAFRPGSSAEQLAALAVCVEAVDGEALERELATLSWQDVLAIRREILPRVRDLRREVRRLARAQAGNGDLADYRRAVRDLHGSLRQAQEQLASAWEALRITAVLRLGGTVGAAGMGGMTLPLGWGQALISVVAGALVGGALVAPQVVNYYSALRRRRAESMLYFTELPSTIARSLER